MKFFFLFPLQVPLKMIRSIVNRGKYAIAEANMQYSIVALVDPSTYLYKEVLRRAGGDLLIYLPQH